MSTENNARPYRHLWPLRWLIWDRHPGLSGLFSGVLMLGILAIIMPPFAWLARHLFGPVLHLISSGFTWWFEWWR
jgi:hypothetical protein